MAGFGIRVEPDGSARGRIRIGDFVESFDLDSSVWSCIEYQRSWAAELRRLLQGHRSVAVLWTWRYPRPFVGTQRGWICFREGVRVFIQERLFVPGEHDSNLDGDGRPIEIKREEMNEEGNCISQWETTPDAIASFLGHDGPI